MRKQRRGASGPLPETDPAYIRCQTLCYAVNSEKVARLTDTHQRNGAPEPQRRPIQLRLDHRTMRDTGVRDGRLERVYRRLRVRLLNPYHR